MGCEAGRTWEQEQEKDKLAGSREVTQAGIAEDMPQLRRRQPSSRRTSAAVMRYRGSLCSRRRNRSWGVGGGTQQRERVGPMGSMRLEGPPNSRCCSWCSEHHGQAHGMANLPSAAACAQRKQSPPTALDEAAPPAARTRWAGSGGRAPPPWRLRRTGPARSHPALGRGLCAIGTTTATRTMHFLVQGHNCAQTGSLQLAPQLPCTVSPPLEAQTNTNSPALQLEGQFPARACRLSMSFCCF